MSANFGDWSKILDDYSYASREKIYGKIEKKGLVAKPDDYSIIHEIVLWKLDREINIDFEQIEYLNSIAKQIVSQDLFVAKKSEIVDFVDDLIQNSDGIRIAMASTILHFYQPKIFPIIDTRAYRQAMDKNLTPASGGSEYFDYCLKCFDICKNYGIPISDIDKVLYQIDINLGFTINDKVIPLKSICQGIGNIITSQKVSVSESFSSLFSGVNQIDSLNDAYHFDSGVDLISRFITELEKLNRSDLKKYVEILDEKLKRYL